MKSLEELRAIRDKMELQVNMRTEDHLQQIRVVVGLATCGIASGARLILNKFAETVIEKGLDNVIVTQTGCIGLCQYEPIVEIIEPGKDKVTYINVTPDKVNEIIQSHLIDGKIIAKYTVGGIN